MRARRVLVTGAGGKTGRAVLRALTAEDTPARALVRDRERHRDLLQLGDVEVVVGDQRDADALVAAMDGCDAIYHIAPNVTPDELPMGEAVLAACQRAGITRLVFHSVADPHEPAMPHHADKGVVETWIMATDLAWTILRPNAYLQNLDGYLDDLLAGRYRVPYAVDRGLALVDLREVAEVAAGAVTGRLEGAVAAIWELAGPATVTPADVAEVAGQVLGRSVVAERQEPDAWLAEAEAAGLPADARSRLHRMFRHYDRHGFPGDASTLRSLLGREPTDLRSYLRERLSTASA